MKKISIAFLLTVIMTIFLRFGHSLSYTYFYTTKTEIATEQFSTNGEDSKIGLVAAKQNSRWVVDSVFLVSTLLVWIAFAAYAMRISEFPKNESS